MAQRLINDHRRCASRATGIQETEESQKLLRSLAKVDLLIIDEFGYLPHDKEAGPLFYQVISDRYEQKGTIITSNKSLTAWAEVLHDSSLAAALIDRLMHHGEVFYLSGDSYRLRGKQKYLEGNTTSEEPEMVHLSENQRKGGDK
jgi:DNA replication protein DnaC